MFLIAPEPILGGSYWLHSGSSLFHVGSPSFPKLFPTFSQPWGPGRGFPVIFVPFPNLFPSFLRKVLKNPASLYPTVLGNPGPKARVGSIATGRFIINFLFFYVPPRFWKRYVKENILWKGNSSFQDYFLCTLSRRSGDKRNIKLIANSNKWHFLYVPSGGDPVVKEKSE